MIRTRLATAEDVYVACENPLPIFQNGHDHTLGLLAAVDKGLALALEDQFNNLCGVVSIAVMWGGVASFGAVLTPHIQKQPVAAIKVCRFLLRKSEIFFKLHRIEVYIQTDYKTGHRWARALGFQPEGVLRKFGPDGKDHTIYGRV